MFTPHHVAISVSDMQASIDFYYLFWFTVFYEYSDENVKITHLKLGNFLLEIFCYTDYSLLPKSAVSNKTDLPIIGTKHFALQVDDIEQARKFCSNHDIEIISEIKQWRTDIMYFFFKDPDDIMVEIVQDNR